MIELGIYLHRLRKDYNVWGVGVLFFLSYVIGEFWNCSSTPIHYFWSGTFYLPGDYFTLFRNGDVNRFVEAAAFLLAWSKPDKRQIPFFAVYLCYRILDIFLFYYNGNTKYESIVYILSGLADFSFVVVNIVKGWQRPRI